MYFSPVVDCGNPTDLANGNVTFEETTFGHIANYTCGSGHWFNREQRQTVTKCEDNGNWTHVGDTCKGVCLYSCDSFFNVLFITDIRMHKHQRYTMMY